MRLLSSSLSLTAFAAAIAVGVRNNERESLSLENAGPRIVHAHNMGALPFKS